MPSLHPHRYANDEEYRNSILDLVDRGVGGFCVFQGSMEEAAQCIAELQARADIPLLFSADYEHGLPMRLEGGTDFPHAMALGIAHDPQLTRSVSTAIARECKALGIHWNFAPVCDINSNKNNPIINVRSFGESIGEVVPQVLNWIDASQEQRVMACAKHFPGHGDTSVDSHISLPQLDHDMQRLSTLELVPFYAAIRSGVRSVMVAHLAVPALDPTNRPASLSPIVVQRLLRTQLSYDGLVVTDALDMKSVADSYSSAEASVMAVSAGCDVVLIPENPIEAIDALAAAAEQQPEIRQRIHDSLQRVWREKAWVGLFERSTHRPDAISLEEHGMLALKVATEAVRVQGDESVLPLEQYKHIACFAFLNNEDLDPASEFFHYLAQVYEHDTDIAYLNADISDEELQATIDSVQEAECVVFAVFARARAYAGTVGIDPRLIEAAKRIAGTRPSIAVLFGNPYIAETFPANLSVLCYSDSKPSRGAACLRLTNSSLRV